MLPKHDKPMLRVLLRASMIGIQLVVVTFIGLAIGIFLDNLLGSFGFHTRPWLTFIFLGLGIFTGFYDMYRMAKEAMGETKNDTTSAGENPDTGYQEWKDDDWDEKKNGS